MTSANPLPAYDIADRVNRLLRQHNRLVITAPPGAGKSTVLPLTILQAFPDARIVMLEPRRIAARAVAERMADTLSESVGKHIGYIVKDDRHEAKGKGTINVVTEGILTRMLVDDPTLSDIDFVLFDEIHERSLPSELGLALCREAQTLLREDLRIVLMSATIDAEHLCRELDAPLVQSEGRLFPVEIRHIDTDIAHTIRQAWRETEGDILVFLPGEAEIRRLAEALSETSMRIFPLYGRLDKAAQRAAIAPSRPGERKVVLATNVAETSLTIEGVRVVIDSGLMRKAVYQPRTGMSRLETVAISLDMATQRAGRAGRVTSGICYRLYTTATEARMAPQRTPEIAEADLSSLVLSVAAWGGVPEDLQWLTPPPDTALRQARELLRLLGALDEHHRITPMGRRMERRPYHPRLARMLELGGSPRLADILEDGKDNVPHTYEAGRQIATAYPERVARSIGNGRFRLAAGGEAFVEPDSLLAAEPWLACAAMADSSNGANGGRIFTAAPLRPEDISDLCYTHRVLRYDRDRGQVVGEEQLRIGLLVISSRSISQISPEERLHIAIEAVRKEGKSLLNWSDEAQRLRQRVDAVRAWHPDQDWPDLSPEAVMQHPERWLLDDRLQRLNLAEALLSLLSYEQQQLLGQLAPEHVVVPTGSRIRLDYRPGAEAPVLSVRLQECFGLQDTPRVDNGRLPVLMELLSPGYKPVQLTRDLRSFWSNTYFEVRKELRRRYPKHSWPDNPLAADPVRGVKKK